MAKKRAPENPNKSFTDGFLDGFHTIFPGINPGIPAHAIPAGKTEYQHGYDEGVAKAMERKGEKPPKNSPAK